MSLQRDVSPLPPGRYWVTLTNTPRVAPDGRWQTAMHVFRVWQGFNRSIVKVEASEQEPSGASEFVIFRVLAPAFLWDAAQLGYPNFADESVRFRQDVEQSPIIPDLSTQITDAASSFGAGLGAVGTALLLFLLWKAFDKGR